MRQWCIAYVLGIWGVKQLKGALMFKAPHIAVVYTDQACAREGASQQPCFSAHVPGQYPLCLRGRARKHYLTYVCNSSHTYT